MKKLIVLIITIALLLFGKKGWGYINKYRHADRIKVGVESFSFPKLNLSSILSDIVMNININLGNYSPSSFNISQINVDVFDKEGKLIAEQKNPLAEGIQIAANQNTILPLTYLISSGQLNKLIIGAGGYASVGAKYLTTGKYGINIHLKGFVQAEGFNISINEKVSV